MAWNDKPTVRDAGEFAKKHGFDKVVILGINESKETLEGISYGFNAKKCNEAKLLLNAAYDAVFKKLECGYCDDSEIDIDDDLLAI